MWIKPGTGQRLEFSTDPLIGSGLFRQAARTRLKFDDVVFRGCYNFNGPGGVLDSEGRVRFNRCRFETCFASEVRVIPAMRALENAYAPMNEIFGLSNGVYEIIRKAIPPGFHGSLTNAPVVFSNAQAACLQTLSVLLDGSKTFQERLDLAAACKSNFVASTERAAEAFNTFYLFAPTIIMCLNDRNIYVNTDLFGESLASARVSMDEFVALRADLQTNEVAVSSSGGALRIGDTGECIVYDASAQACTAIGGGGFLDNAGDFKGVNLTLTGNMAIEGGCILNSGGTNQLAGVAIVDNYSELKGAVSVRGGAIGFLNSIVIANEGGSVASAKDVTVTSVHSLVEGDTPIAKSDVFASTAALEGSVSNHLAQLYYPLKPNGLASHTGTFVFFNSDTVKQNADGVDSEWIKNILHETNPDGVNPDAQWFFGSGRPRWNAYLLYDLLGNLIRIWENKETFEGPIAASMGPVPNVPPEAAGLIVTTFDDVVSAVDNETSLREAAAYAMEIGISNVVSVGFKLDGTYTLQNQIVVPSGRTLRISATRGRVTLKPAKTLGNRFFRVERGGRLELNGLTLDGGYAKGDYDVGMRPTNDDDGGAICSEGTLVLTDCTVQNCKANGYGGAVWSSGGMTATRCTFTENFAQRGGGICSYDEPLQLSGVSITGNIAQDYGGGLYLVTGANDVLATGMTITRNNAKGETVTTGPNCGGGVYLTANMSANPGTVTILGTVADNTGGNDSRDGGTEPVSNVETPEASEKVFVPPQPTPRLMSAAPRLMSAANVLAAAPAAPQQVISKDATLEYLPLEADFDASEQVRITDGAHLTLTGSVDYAGTVDVSSRSFPEGSHPRITVDRYAELLALSGFYCFPGCGRYAELVLDGGTAKLSGGTFVANAGDPSGTITLRNGALLDADMDISLNSDVRANTVSNSTVNLHAKALAVENGARLEMSGSTLQARSLKVGEGGSVVLADCTNKLTSVNVRTAGAGLDVTGGVFQADALTVGCANQGLAFDGVACTIGRLDLDSSALAFSGCESLAFGAIGLCQDLASKEPLSLTFDESPAECSGNVALESDVLPVTLTFRGETGSLHCAGDFGVGVAGGQQPHTLVFDIPANGWTNAPLRIDGDCRLDGPVVIRVTNTDWMRSGEILRVPLIAFKSRPKFMDDEWLKSDKRTEMSRQCALAYDEENNLLVVQYDISEVGPVCRIGDREFTRVSDALECAQMRDTVLLISDADAAPLTIPRYVTLDLNGYYIKEPGQALLIFPRVVRSEGVLVAYHAQEIDALFDDRFTGTMRFGTDVVWTAPNGGGTITFVKDTGVTIGDGTTPLADNPSSVYVATSSFTDTYGLKEGWTVKVFGSAALGGANYAGCMITVDENVRIVTPMKMTDSTLKVDGALTFADGAYIEFGSLTNCSVYSRNLIDFRHLRVADSSKADVMYEVLPDGTYRYYPSEAALPLVAEVDCQRYTLPEAFRVANGNGHDVVLLRDDDGETAELIPVGRDIAFDVNGHWIRGADGHTVTFSVTNGRLDVFGGGKLECVNVAFCLGHGAVGDGRLVLSGGTYATTNGAPVISVDAACTAAVLALTNGTEIAAPDDCAMETLVRLDGFADCIFDDATVEGCSATNAIVHHAARIVVTNDAKLLSKGVTIRQTASSACPAYDFTLEVSGDNSLIRSFEGPHCVASELTANAVGTKSVTNRFTCASGCLQCPKFESNAAVSFFGGLEYDVTGGWFGGSVVPPVSPNYVAVGLPPEYLDLYWQVVRPGQAGVYVVKIGDTRYESLEEAFSFVHSNDLVTMIANYSPSYDIKVKVPVTLVLNGFMIGRQQSAQPTLGITVEPSQTLTVEDGVGSGRIAGIEFDVAGTLKVADGTFGYCRITGDGTLEFDGGTLDENSSIVGTGKTTLIVRNGTFMAPIYLTDSEGSLFKNIAVSDGEFHGTGATKCPPFYADNADLAPTNFISGGVMMNTTTHVALESDKPMLDKYLVAGYKYERLPSTSYDYRVVKDEVVIARVDGTDYTSLQKAFDAAATAHRKEVTLIADCTKKIDSSVKVTKSVMFVLNGHILSPSSSLEFDIVSNATLVVDSLYPESVCTNVQFRVGDTGSETGSLHLAGGSYFVKDHSIVHLRKGTCLIDHGARLEMVRGLSQLDRAVVKMSCGTLAMTNAVLVGTHDGVRYESQAHCDGKCSLHFGDGTKIFSADRPVDFRDNDGSHALDLDISGTNCEIRSTSGYYVIEFNELLSNQAGISGGRYYGKLPDRKDDLLAKNYKWEEVSGSERYWTPVELPDVAEVDGQKFKSLAEAFAAANASGKSVKLLVDYRGAGGQLSVTKSYELELGKHDFRPSSLLMISISDGASFKLAGDPIDCQNVYFVVGGANGSAGALHLSGGDYGDVQIDTEQAGTCLIDGGAHLVGDYCPVRMHGGTLAVTNATISGLTYGICADVFSSVTNVLRIGNSVEVSSRLGSALNIQSPSKEGVVDLDISGTCIFRAPSDIKVITSEAEVTPGQAGITGGRFFGARPDDTCLNKDYGWKRVNTESAPCWTPYLMPDVAEVNGRRYKSLDEAFAAAAASGRPVKLVANYTYRGGSLSVAKSCELNLNGYVLAPSEMLDMTISGGASFKLNGTGVNSTCSNVHFVVQGESDSKTVALHLAGGQYEYDAGGNFDSVVTIMRGTCLIDGGAVLKGKFPVEVCGGTLAMTNATIHAEKNGIWAWNGSGSATACTNVLRIGKGVKVYTAATSGFAPILARYAWIDLDISGNCEFHAQNSNGSAIVCDADAVPGQAGISGGFFYGKKPGDKYLNEDYEGWENVGSESAPCWTPVKVDAPPPVNEGIRIEDGKVFSGDFEITDAVTVRSDGSVELNSGGRVGGVRVTPVIGDLPPAEGDETEPFAVGEGSVSLTVQTIPGLTYVLLRGETPDKVDVPVASSMATKNVMTLEDFDKPKDGAFYLIKVMIK